MLEAHNLQFCKESLFKSWTSSAAAAYMHLFQNQAMEDTASTTLWETTLKILICMNINPSNNSRYYRVALLNYTTTLQLSRYSIYTVTRIHPNSNRVRKTPHQFHPPMHTPDTHKVTLNDLGMEVRKKKNQLSVMLGGPSFNLYYILLVTRQFHLLLKITLSSPWQKCALSWSLPPHIIVTAKHLIDRV